jgi:hypothetical protein
MAARGAWIVERIVRFPEGREYGAGYSLLGFHDPDGTQFVLEHGRHWVGAYESPNVIGWSAGRIRPPESQHHIVVDLSFPMYLARARDDSFLVSNFGNGRIVRIVPDEGRAEALVEGARLGLRDVGNCVVDAAGSVWVNEVTGCRIWSFDPSGEPVVTLGDGEPGFQSGDVGWKDARFSWIYDIRPGPNGRLYALDSGNFAVRVIDPRHEVVETIAGTGVPGYTGDGGDAKAATFGSDPTTKFDGPLSLSVDELGNVFVGDTRNRVVRMIDARTNVISTIAGNPEAGPGDRSDPDERDPLALALFDICSMDYFGGRLFVPDGRGDLAILTRTP